MKRIFVFVCEPPVCLPMGECVCVATEAFLYR